MNTAQALETPQTGSRKRNDFDIHAAKAIIADLMEPNPFHYWVDMLVSSCAGWITLMLSLSFPWTSPLGALLIVVSAFCSYRTLGFNHDLAHIHKKWTPALSFVWNLLSGIPFFQPTSMYGFSHLEHHAVKQYATKQDPRYVPIGLGPRRGWVIPLFVHTWIVPVVMAYRFLILGPISLIIGGSYRKRIIQFYSTLRMNLQYERRLPTPKEASIAAAQEITGAIMWGTAIGLYFYGVLPGKFFLTFYLINVLIMTFHYLRSLCIHRYALIGEGNFSFSEVILDTISFNRPRFLVQLLCPTNTNYHSLHHMFPTLPYHTMDEANDRLQRKLPADHPYRRSFAPSMIHALVDLWNRCKLNELGYENEQERA